MWWPWSRSTAYPAAVTETRAASWSISDPVMVEHFGLSTTLAGMSVSENSALSLSAVYRAVSLISQTCATLPMRTITTNAEGYTERARSFLDTPGGVNGLTAFEWKEIVLVHLLLHGNAYLAHIYGGAGQIVGLVPIHPLAASVEMQPDGTKLFTVSLADGTRRMFTDTQLTHIPALSTDGITGLSPLDVARQVFGTGLAGDRAAARMFTNGAMLSGLVTPEEDLTEDEAKTIKESLRRKMAGVDNAGDIAVINRKLKFDKWSMSAEDAQFLESRQFQVEEIARFYGVPPHLLMQTEKQTSWGTGVREQNLGLARYTLEPWTTRIQERLSRLLGPSKKIEFDYSAFVQPDPEAEINLLVAQIDSGLLTLNEARKIRNMPPVPGGDALPTDPVEGGTDETDTATEGSDLGVLQRFGVPMTLPPIGTPSTNGVRHD